LKKAKMAPLEEVFAYYANKPELKELGVSSARRPICNPLWEWSGLRTLTGFT
jgi:hypothetical protein